MSAAGNRTSVRGGGPAQLESQEQDPSFHASMQTGCHDANGDRIGASHSPIPELPKDPPRLQRLKRTFKRLSQLQGEIATLREHLGCTVEFGVTV